MAKIILITHQKGGVGKSTLTFNLACNLKESAKVCILDMDNQGSLLNISELSQVPVFTADMLNEKLIKEYDFIFIETLNLEGMRRLWGKKISDLSHSMFIDKLRYVASKYGVTVHQIDKWFPSSKTCECGYVYKSLSLLERTWVCPKCGSVNDRDLLASKNILRKGISELESTGNSNGCKTGVPYTCIQESQSLYLRRKYLRRLFDPGKEIL